MRKVTSHHLRVAAACLVVGSVLGATAEPAAAATSSAARSAALQPCHTQDSGSYPPGSSQIGLQISSERAGQTNVVGGSGFATASEPGGLGTVALQICSAPESLGTAHLTADGSFNQTVTIPSDIPPGQHVVQAQGPNGQGGTVTLVTTLTIVASSATGTSTGTSTNGSLPFTGFDLVPLVLTALLLLVTGAGLVVVTRERRRRTTA